MKIAGFQKLTLIDYPEKIACSIFLSGCTFKCGFCHNPELVHNTSPELEINHILSEIKSRQAEDWCEGVCISGGEPTIHPELIDFIKILKGMGLAVKLDTNGNNPKMLMELLENKLVDYVAMDIKAPKNKYTNLTGLKDVDKIEKSINIVKLFPEYEFRTTVIPTLSDADFISMGKWISETGKVKLYTLQQFRNEKTLDPAYGQMKPKGQKDLERIKEIMEEFTEQIRILGD